MINRPSNDARFVTQWSPSFGEPSDRGGSAAYDATLPSDITIAPRNSQIALSARVLIRVTAASRAYLTQPSWLVASTGASFPSEPNMFFKNLLPVTTIRTPDGGASYQSLVAYNTITSVVYNANQMGDPDITTAQGYVGGYVVVSATTGPSTSYTPPALPLLAPTAVVATLKSWAQVSGDYVVTTIEALFGSFGAAAFAIDLDSDVTTREALIEVLIDGDVRNSNFFTTSNFVISNVANPTINQVATPVPDLAIYPSPPASASFRIPVNTGYYIPLWAFVDGTVYGRTDDLYFTNTGPPSDAVGVPGTETSTKTTMPSPTTQRSCGYSVSANAELVWPAYVGSVFYAGDAVPGNFVFTESGSLVSNGSITGDLAVNVTTIVPNFSVTTTPDPVSPTTTYTVGSDSTVQTSTGSLVSNLTTASTTNTSSVSTLGSAYPGWVLVDSLGAVVSSGSIFRRTKAPTLLPVGEPIH